MNLVGCNNPRLIYEKHIVEAAEILLKNNILILTNGCASFALLKLGFCSTKALAVTGDSLRQFCEEHGNIPPVWHLGECLDAAESLTLDFGKLEYISSAGLRVLLSTHKAMSKKGGMKITNVNEIVKEVFEVTGFSDILTIE